MATATSTPAPALAPPDPELVRDLGRILAPERVLSRPIDRLGRSVDASVYRLIPEAVVRPRDLGELRGLLAYARRNRRGLTFRTAGTSLSGQAVTDQILVELAPHWHGARVLDAGARIWAQPGVVGGYLNSLLAPHGRRIGPDPASIDTAMLGGILSNNSSGMCCGVAQNSYRTLHSLRFLLADGTLVDSGAPDADARLRGDRPELHAALAALRDEVRADEELHERIRRKFSIKNTTGYSLNALLDHHEPVQILAHLMVGAEGTLGFIADATLDTVPDPPHRATALLYFDELVEAGAAIAPLAEAGAAALEIMDAACLRAQAQEVEHPVPVSERTAAILAEVRAEDPASLAAAVTRAEDALRSFRTLTPVLFTTEAAERDRLWRLRKGLITLVGGMRPPGTAVLIEDVAVPVAKLAEAIGELRALLERCELRDSVIFGHAKDGNLHFLLVEDFASPEVVERYDRFMRGLVELIAGCYGGSLKAEHGSGRNMAPFVKDEWGEAAYAVMRRIKQLLDPDGILNPGVLLNDDPRLHVKNLKPLPEISPLASRCIECGFCEPRCPSRFLTLSPRQRIVVRREIARLGALDTAWAREWRDSLERDFAYEGTTTCAGDGMCQMSCPVKIDTGALVKELKAEAHPRWARRLAGLTARRFGGTARAARAGLGAAAALRRLPGGGLLLEAVTGVLHRAAPALLPRVPRDMALPWPARRPPRPAARPDRARRVVYFPSCLSRILGALPGEPGASPVPAMLEVLDLAGYGVAYPAGVADLCCGMPFASKAFPEAARAAGDAALDAMVRSAGDAVVVTDASPCAATLRDRVAERSLALRVLDFPAFWAREVLPGMASPPRRPGTAVLHPTCSLVKAGGLEDLLRVARAHSEAVLVPPGAECCGFAGDRGFLVPELTATATRREAGEVREQLARNGDGAALYSTCRTCEIGMGRAVGRPYASLVELVREALARG